MSRKPGFTLTQLLVVVAVIATLAGILLPVFAQAREQARQTTCLSNCRQIGMAMMLYIQDHDDVLLPVWEARSSVAFVPWTALLQPYLKNEAVFFCPSFDERVLEENAALPTCDGPGIRIYFPVQHYYAHYGMPWGYAGGRCTPEAPRSRDAGNDYGN